MLNRFGFRTLLMLMLLVLSLGLLAAGCGDDDDDSGDSGDTVEMTTPEEAEDPDAEEPEAEEPAAAAPQEFQVPAADSGLAFAVTEVTASPGEITLTSVNNQAVPHNIAIDEPTQQIGEIVQDGGTSTITVTIDEPGEYEFYCSVPGHREAGMVGTLIVQ